MFKIKLYMSLVSPFSLESNFNPYILTRLEARGVEVATLLKEFHSIQDSALDLQEMEKMLQHWSDGILGDRPPSWEELLEVFNSVGLKKLSQKIYGLLQGMCVQIDILTYKSF